MTSALTLLELDLSRGLLESSPQDPVAALRARHMPTLSGVVSRLREAADDTSVVGLVAHVGPDVLTPAQAEELGAAVEALAAAGKQTACWTESFGELGSGTLPYHLAAHFDEVWVQPSGMVGLVGVATRGVFLRGALDRLGLEPQIGQRHEFKSAADQLVREDMSEAQREATQRLADSVTEQVVATVARRRGLPADDVRAAVDSGPLTAQEAMQRGLVDRIGYRDELYDELRRRLGRADPDAGSAPEEERATPELTLRYVHRRPSPGLRSLAGPAALPSRAGLREAGRRARRAAHHRRQPVVALVAVEGAIGLGRSGPAPLGGRRAGADTVCAALRTAGRRDDVEAVVLRVVSPGGSYVASDAIHREVLQLGEQGKPVVVSMGSVAASGGYFVAMPAAEIVALPSTVTGSIGVLGGKVAVGEGLRRIGIGTEPVGSGANATMFDPTRPFSEQEWRQVEGWLDAVYADFTTKAAEGRRLPYETLEPLARGRVWTGADAHQRGLVDTLGGLDEAITRASQRIGMARDRVRVERVPHLSALERLRPAESSESAAAAVGTGSAAAWWSSGAVGWGGSVAEDALRQLGLTEAGVLSLPGPWRVR